MKLKTSPETTLERFRSWQLVNPNPDQTSIRQFVADNFDPEGSEFEPWIPDDHVATPAFLRHVRDENYLQFGQALHDLWLSLGRKITDDVLVSSINRSMTV